MKTLPPNVSPYKRTAEFTDRTVPPALLRGHDTKAGVWATIVVLEGTLLYRILEPALQEVPLAPGTVGIVEPVTKHEVVPEPGVRFYVEFYREAP